MKASLQSVVGKLAKSYDVAIDIPSAQEGLENLVEELSTKGRVVVLIDEYDKPLIDNLHNPEVVDGNRRLLQDFFGVLKNLDKHIKFTFITGISRFSRVSVFSGANHLEDISMDAQYAAMMGYTQEELVQYFGQYVQAIIQERNQQEQSWTEEKVLAEIKDWYNGYRFSEEEIYVYNLFSTLNYLRKKKPNSYWYASGTPAFLVEEVKKRYQEAVSVSQMLATQDDLSDIHEAAAIPLPALLFQAGYLTIQDYQVDLDAYQLDFPNKEVRKAFFTSMLTVLGKLQSLKVARMADKLRESLSTLDLDAFFSIIKTHFSKITYHIYPHDKEGPYQALFLTFLELSGIHTQSEIATNKGRIDVLCQLSNMFYIFELKVDQRADKAMEQVLDQEYSQLCRHQGKKIVVMGVSFSSEEHNIGSWQGELLDEHGALIRKLAPAPKQ